jgi:hypothetical protein
MKSMKVPRESYIRSSEKVLSTVTRHWIVEFKNQLLGGHHQSIQRIARGVGGLLCLRNCPVEWNNCCETYSKDVQHTGCRGCTRLSELQVCAHGARAADKKSYVPCCKLAPGNGFRQFLKLIPRWKPPVFFFFFRPSRSWELSDSAETFDENIITKVYSPLDGRLLRTELRTSDPPAVEPCRSNQR